jgi:Leucine-rich repeat (LRR) protein
MARGWESKAVEAQVEMAETRMATSKAHRTPEELEKLRQRESLLMSRNRVLQDLEQSSNPRYRKILSDALAHLDAKLAQLD